VAVTYLLTRKNIKWYKNEVKVFFIPFLIWFLLNLFCSKGKSLSNLIELRYISFGIGIVNLISIIVFRKESHFKPEFDLIVSILLSIIVYFSFPLLIE